MSVMTPDQLRQGQPAGDPRRQLPIEPAQLQRQAVMDQLGTQQAPAAPAVQPLPGAQPTASAGGAFARGGSVKQLPGLDKNKLAEMGASTTAGVAGKLLGNTAGGAAAGAGINLATGAIADKLKVKEEMPTFGGEFGHLTDDYGRRFEGTGGGIASNAVRYAGYGANPALVAATGGLSVAAGAIGGAIKGAVTKNAPSAFTDFRSEDAADAIGKAYQEYYGRPATEDEIRGAMVGQGWDEKGGDRWMGEKPLNYVLGAIKGNAATEQAQRAALLEQMGTGGGAPAGEPVATTPGTAARGGAPETGAAAASAPPDSSGWNTDGYAAPGYVPAQAGAVPPGWDATKWNNPNHQTPKYGVGRILSNFPPTVEGLTAAFPDIEKAYPGATFNGKDKLTIPGVGTVDVLQGASKGGEAWRWGAEDGGGGAPAQASGRAAGGAVDIGPRPQQPDVMDKDTLAKIRAELERIMAGQPNREAVLAQMGGGNG
jgi:hypothetical protein